MLSSKWERKRKLCLTCSLGHLLLSGIFLTAIPPLLRTCSDTDPAYTNSKALNVSVQKSQTVLPLLSCVTERARLCLCFLVSNTACLVVGIKLMSAYQGSFNKLEGKKIKGKHILL